MENASYQQLAKEFMDMWQKQLSSVVADKQFIHAMLEMMQSMQQTGPHAQKRQNASSATPSAHAAHAFDGDVANLAFRLAMCEKRLAALEAGTGGKSRPAKRNSSGSKKPRR